MHSCLEFLGPELGEKNDALDEIRRNLGPALEENSIYAGEIPVSEMVSRLRNGSLFSDARLFIIKNAELIKKKDETELLASYLEKPQENTVTVLVSEELRLDKRIEDAVPKDARRIFWELFENKKNEWVSSFFRRAGCRIDPGAVAVILEMVENNTDALRRECGRLVLFLGKDRLITAEDVEKCLSHTREESTFTLFSALARGNTGRSIEILHALLAAKESSQAVIAGLAWCYRKLRDYNALAASGGVNDFELKKIGLGSSKTRTDYVEASRLWPRADGALTLIARYALLLRSSGTGFEEILLDRLVCALCRTV